MIMRTIRKHWGCSSVNQTLYNMLEPLYLIPRNTYIHACTHAHTHNVSALRSLLLKISGKFSGVTDKQPTGTTPIHTNATFKEKRHSDPKCPPLLETSFNRQSLNFFSLPLSWAYSSHDEKNLSWAVVKSPRTTPFPACCLVLLTLSEVSQHDKRR